MARRFGITPGTAREQLQRTQTPAPTEATQPLPTPTGQPPFHATPADLGFTDGAPLTFFVIGDSGGIKDPDYQNNVSNAMQAWAGTPATFAYHVGDLVYFNGDEADYPSQFYEPYGHLTIPIIGIPGNHDGDNSDDPTVPSLSAFMSNLCATSAALPAGSEEYNRDTETQPNCYWTFLSKAVTVIGCYSNVPTGGVIEPDQAAWLTSELQEAPVGVPLIVALHHPPYSADAFHGGSPKMGAVLDAAFQSSGRTPDLVLSGHVHDYQRFTRTTAGGRQLPYVVIGNSGYHNLHKLASGATDGEELGPGVVFEAADDSNWGFLTLTVSGTTITGEYTSVAKDGTATAKFDSFIAGS
jgi:acid phosphatase type 7